MKTILSLGAGVQSSVVALLSKHGELPRIDHAIFSDTGWEPASVYKWLDYLEGELPFPVHRVSAGNLRHDELTKNQGFLPYFVKRETGERGITQRACTHRYKIMPIEKEVSRLIGRAKGKRWPKTPLIDQWFGISLDEIQRMKISQRPAIVFKYPLIDTLRMTRGDCLAWMEAKGYPLPPRSACIGCPFHSDDEWRRLRDDTPDEWVDAIAFDAAFRAREMTKYPAYLHASLVPLDEVDLRTAEDHGQLSFLDECEGMCGV